MVEKTKEALASEPDLWERRWKVALMTYRLEDWQLALQEAHVEDPEDKSFDTAHQFLLGALQAFYRETTPQGVSGNPLFDSDDDGIFDDEDRYPLDPLFSHDADEDRMPDSLDSDPADLAQWNGLGPNEHRSIKTANGEILLRVHHKEESTILELPVRFQFEDDSVRQAFRAQWPQARVRVEEFLNNRAPQGIQIRVRESQDSARMVMVVTKDIRDEAHIWGIGLLGEDQAPALAHEVMHWLLMWRGLLADRYQEDYHTPRDHVFEPGREVLVRPKDLMRYAREDAIILPEDLMIPVGLALYPVRSGRAAQAFRGETLREIAAAYDVAGDFERNFSRRAFDYRKMLENSRWAVRETPEDSMAWHSLAASYQRLSGTAGRGGRGLGLCRLLLDSASRAVELAPRDGATWHALFNGHSCFAGNRVEEWRHGQAAVDTAHRAVALLPKNYSTWHSLAIAHAGLSEMVGTLAQRDHLMAALRSARQAEALNPSSSAVGLLVPQILRRLNEVGEREAIFGR